MFLVAIPLLERVNDDVVGIVVDDGQLRAIITRFFDGNSKGSTLSWIHIELTNEFAADGELDVLAGLPGVRVHGVAVAGD